MVDHAGIKVEGLSFSIGEFTMASLSLIVERGEYFVLTGANGAGKTVLIRLIAGLFQPLAGRIWLHGKDIVAVPPWERGVGYVPQDGVLFPNRTVRGNIGFGLEVRGITGDRQEEEVKRVAELTGITHLLERLPRGLSGGERQKVSISRALACGPEVLLLDEPVSSIDELARDNLCVDLKRIQQETGITTIHISHNSKETELVADRVCVLESGGLRSLSPVSRSQTPL